MKTTPRAVQRRCRARGDNGNILKIEGVTPEDRKRFDHLLGQYHYLGETCPVGDFPAPSGDLGWGMGGFAGVGVGLLCAEGSRPIHWLDADLTGGTAKTGGPKPALPAVAGERGRAELDVADFGCVRQGAAGTMAGLLWLCAVAGGDLHRPRGLRRHLL